MTPDDKKRIASDKKRVEDIRNNFNLSQEDREFLLAKLDEAHEALRFYANSDNWVTEYDHYDKAHYFLIMEEDKGKIARKALGIHD